MIMSRIRGNSLLAVLIVVGTTESWSDERRLLSCSRTREQVSRYWCNSIRGSHMEQLGCFWWIFLCISLSSGGDHFFTVLLLHHLCSTPSGRRNIQLPFLCFTSRVPQKNYLGKAQDSGYRRFQYTLFSSRTKYSWKYICQFVDFKDIGTETK